MRWQGQDVGATDAAALPGMERLSGFVRSVTTPEFAGVTFHEVMSKSALNRVPSSSAMPFDWTVNPYRGCSHACSYCFARGTHEYLDLDAGHDFDSQVVVKVNVADVLRHELSRGTWGREPVALGTNTDPYQRAEGRYRLMPGIIDALAESGTPFSILTKGTLLRRDLPQLVDAASHVPVSLAMSIAIFDDTLQHSVEPGTPSTAARLQTVRAATDAGFAVTVFLMPILPHLTDSIRMLDDALARIRAAGAVRVVFGALHLRPGAKGWFLQWLGQQHPELVSSYRGLYPGVAAYAPKGYRAWLGKRVRPLLRAHGLDGRLEDDQPRRAVTGPVVTTSLAAPRGAASPRRVDAAADRLF
ncbi:Rv2578c family radical SAM protein [Microbacterium horticulturae]|uniref:Rv2578c family radical SAM protein n=1 Tax=Microbacterium horticulturae TaxID=3028316 RepID=A0ABY8BY44_9MICO|nr:Rv2578c family radical SAM protein [Microbacterium sp. KACC 23027]WEG09111.1 Rv2578c family radical SAM protein [Microbacterium sp. KACC 23027]